METIAAKMNLCNAVTVKKKKKKWLNLYSAFTDTVKHNCHFLAPSSKCCNIGKFLYCFHGTVFDLYKENLVVLGSESGSEFHSTSSLNALYSYTSEEFDCMTCYYTETPPLYSGGTSSELCLRFVCQSHLTNARTVH
jgi:hypothetical protein